MHLVNLRAEVGRLMRFGLVGGAATLLHLCVAMSLHFGLDVSVQLANSIAFGTAFFVSFLGHHRFSFRSARSHRQTFPVFVASAGLGYLASAVVLELAQGAGSGLSLVVAVAAVPAVTYFASRFWVF